MVSLGQVCTRHAYHVHVCHSPAARALCLLAKPGPGSPGWAPCLAAALAACALCVEDQHAGAPGHRQAGVGM